MLFATLLTLALFALYRPIYRASLYRTFRLSRHLPAEALSRTFGPPTPFWCVHLYRHPSSFTLVVFLALIIDLTPVPHSHTFSALVLFWLFFYDVPVRVVDAALLRIFCLALHEDLYKISSSPLRASGAPFSNLTDVTMSQLKSTQETRKMVKGSIRVVSKRKAPYSIYPLSDETVIDIDRTNPVLGNRYVLRDHRDACARAEVVAAHKRDFDADLAANGPMSKQIAKLAERVGNGEKIALRCWCATTTGTACHGDNYAAEIRRRVFKAEEIF